LKEVRMSAQLPSELLRRVQGEFLEMPGLRLTEAQACRLWGLDAQACAALLSELIDAEFLVRTQGGTFMYVGSPMPAKASLRPSHKISAA
jgi:hypothetical protein